MKNKKVMQLLALVMAAAVTVTSPGTPLLSVYAGEAGAAATAEETGSGTDAEEGSTALIKGHVYEKVVVKHTDTAECYPEGAVLVDDSNASTHPILNNSDNPTDVMTPTGESLGKYYVESAEKLLVKHTIGSNEVAKEQSDTKILYSYADKNDEAAVEMDKDKTVVKLSNDNIGDLLKALEGKSSTTITNDTSSSLSGYYKITEFVEYTLPSDEESTGSEGSESNTAETTQASATADTTTTPEIAGIIAVTSADKDSYKDFNGIGELNLSENETKYFIPKEVEKLTEYEYGEDGSKTTVSLGSEYGLTDDNASKYFVFTECSNYKYYKAVSDTVIGFTEEGFYEEKEYWELAELNEDHETASGTNAYFLESDSEQSTEIEERKVIKKDGQLLVDSSDKYVTSITLTTPEKQILASTAAETDIEDGVTLHYANGTETQIVGKESVTNDYSTDTGNGYSTDEAFVTITGITSEEQFFQDADGDQIVDEGESYKLSDVGADDFSAKVGTIQKSVFQKIALAVEDSGKKLEKDPTIGDKVSEVKLTGVTVKNGETEVAGSWTVSKYGDNEVGEDTVFGAEAKNIEFTFTPDTDADKYEIAPVTISSYDLKANVSAADFNDNIVIKFDYTEEPINNDSVISKLNSEGKKTAEIGDVTSVVYKEKETEVTSPTEVGTYDVYVSGKASGNYNAYSNLKVATVKIANKDLSGAYDLKVGSSGGAGYTSGMTVNTSVYVVAKEEYTVATTKTGTFETNIVFEKPAADKALEEYKFYVKDSSGQVYPQVIQIAFDVTAPQITLTASDVQATTAKLLVQPNEAATVSYIVSDKKYDDETSLKEKLEFALTLSSSDDENEAGGSGEDSNGTDTSEGTPDDATTGETTNGADTSEETPSETSAAKAADDITVETVFVTKDTPVSIDLSDLTADTPYRVYMMAADTCGNISGLSYVDFKTYTTAVKITKDPTLSGTYGTAVKKLTLTDGTIEGEPVAGKWSVESSDEIPVVNGTKKYKVTFTPEDSAIAPVTVEVTPTITAVAPTITLSSLEQTVGSVVKPTVTLTPNDPAVEATLSYYSDEECTTKVDFETDVTNAAAGSKFYVKVELSESDNYTTPEEDTFTLTIKAKPNNNNNPYYPPTYGGGSSTGGTPTTPEKPSDTENTDKPDTENPDTEKPDTDKPDTEKPDTEKPDSSAGNTTTETKPDGTVVDKNVETGADGTTTEKVTETKPDGSKTESVTETKADGSKTESVTETKADGSKTETVKESLKDGSSVEKKVETAADGKVVKTTETTTAKDGSAKEVVKQSEKNSAGKEVAVTTVTNTDAAGKVTGIVEQSKIANIAKNTSATVTVQKNGKGKVTEAAANVSKPMSENKVSLSGTIFSQLTEAAGVTKLEVEVKVTDNSGKTKCKIQAQANELVPGAKLFIYEKDSKGNYVMLNSKTYKVNASGGIAISMTSSGTISASKSVKTYELLTEKEAKAAAKTIKATIKAAKASTTVKVGKKTSMSLAKGVDMENVKAVTYTTSKKSVAAVNKSGKVTAKKAGTATIKAKVTLKNGESKSVSMKVKVKKK